MVAVASKSKQIETSKKTAKSNRFYDITKRIFDLIVCILIFPVYFIIYLLIALLIKIQDGGPALYKAKRVGLNGKTFYMYKFRSMKQNAERLEAFLSPEEIATYKKEYKLGNDPRITQLGKFLRKTSLDELPQIINIIKNDMSLIGPRPVIDEEVEIYGEDKALFLSAKPGLTGYWQAYARNDVGYVDGRRQAMELYYVTNKSFLLDIKIIFATIKRVLSRKGAS